MTPKYNIPLSGGCLCQKIRFEIVQAPLLTLACHCKGCQKLTASAFSLSAMVLSDSFKITKGQPVIGGLHKPQSHYYYCDWCKNWLFTRQEPDVGFTNVRAMMFDDVIEFEPYVEVWTSEKLSWAITPAKHSFETEPEMSVYPAIIDEFAKI